ncbi:MAG: hypothetical protein OXU54_05920 [Gammaproteobacteria bacterium]|nr:hypothetical protein [Gammaproteobacteria bacterium]
MRVPVRFSGVFLAVLACVPLGACQLLDKVEEDRRTEYLKSRTLPDLEIPPDLVAADSGEPLVIPGEVPGEESAGPEQTAGETLPGQEEAPEQAAGEAPPGQEEAPEQAAGETLPVQEEAPEQAAGEAPPVQEEAPEQAAGETLPVQEEAPEQAGRQDAGEDAAAAEASESEPAATEPAEAESQFAAVAGRRPVPSPPLEPGLPPPRRDAVLNEQLVKVQGEWKEVWPLLRKFWGSKGLALDLEDLSLGVMETVWTVPYLQQDMTVRNRFKLFLEPGPEEGILHVVLSSEKEVYLEQEGSQEGDWLLQDPDLLLEKKYASELQGFLGEHL